jgi:hypothetical protein
VAADTGVDRRSPSALSSTDARIGFAVIALCLVTVLVLQFAARNAPSANRSQVIGIPTPVVSTAGGCENFARYWTEESGVGASPETIEGMTGCRRAADGSWFIPSGSDDPRLPAAPILTADQQIATAELRGELLAQIDSLKAQFPSTLQRWLDELYDPIPRAVLGHTREGATVRRTRGRYTRLTQAYLMAPERQALADYVGWIMARRIGAYQDFREACFGDPSLEYLRNACRGLEDTLSIRYPPFPWDIEDPLLLDAFLASTLQSETTTPPADR